MSSENKKMCDICMEPVSSRHMCATCRVRWCQKCRIYGMGQNIIPENYFCSYVCTDSYWMDGIGKCSISDFIECLTKAGNYVHFKKVQEKEINTCNYNAIIIVCNEFLIDDICRIVMEY